METLPENLLLSVGEWLPIEDWTRFGCSCSRLWDVVRNSLRYTMYQRLVPSNREATLNEAIAQRQTSYLLYAVENDGLLVEKLMPHFLEHASDAELATLLTHLEKFGDARLGLYDRFAFEAGKYGRSQVIQHVRDRSLAFAGLVCQANKNLYLCCAGEDFVVFLHALHDAIIRKAPLAQWTREHYTTQNKKTCEKHFSASLRYVDAAFGLCSPTVLDTEPWYARSYLEIVLHYRPPFEVLRTIDHYANCGCLIDCSLVARYCSQHQDYALFERVLCLMEEGAQLSLSKQDFCSAAVEETAALGGDFDWLQTAGVAVEDFLEAILLGAIKGRNGCLWQKFCREVDSEFFCENCASLVVFAARHRFDAALEFLLNSSQFSISADLFFEMFVNYARDSEEMVLTLVRRLPYDFALRKELHNTRRKDDSCLQQLIDAGRYHSVLYFVKSVKCGVVELRDLRNMRIPPYILQELERLALQPTQVDGFWWY